MAKRHHTLIRTGIRGAALRTRLTVPISRDVRKRDAAIDRRCGRRREVQISRRRIDEQRRRGRRDVAAERTGRAVARQDPAVEQIVRDLHARRIRKAVLDQRRVGARAEDAVVQHLGAG